MKIRPSRGRDNPARIGATALVLALSLHVTPSLAMEAGAFQPPALEQFIRSSENDADGDGDGVKETRVQRYRNLSGDRVFSLTTKGHLWAWSIEAEGGDDADASQNYVIRDSNCNGTFNERYGLDEEFHLPDCVK